MFATITGIIVLAAPALVFLGMIFLSGAPAEWGRGALTAWLALTSTLIATLAAPVLGHWVVLGVAGCGLLAIITGGGGVTGLIVSAFLAVALVAGQFLIGSYPVHTALAPVLGGIGLLAVLRQFFF